MRRGPGLGGSYRKLWTASAVSSLGDGMYLAALPLLAAELTSDPLPTVSADPVQMYLNDIFTVSANLTGLPAISVPCGFTPDGLPVGLQIIGRRWEDATVLAAVSSPDKAAAATASGAGRWPPSGRCRVSPFP